MRNLHCKFDRYYIGQIYGGDFAKICGLLRIYELYLLIYFLDTRHTPVGCLQNSYAETRHRRSLDLLYHPDCLHHHNFLILLACHLHSNCYSLQLVFFASKRVGKKGLLIHNFPDKSWLLCT